MSLRTPNPFTNRQTLLDLQRTKERLAILNEQLASGRRIVRLGDDPTGSALIVDFKTSIERNKQYEKQIASARSFLRASETSLGTLSDGLARLLELGQQGLSDTTGASGRPRLAQEVDGLRSNFLSISNTQSGGKYLFAGTRTTTEPFSGPSAGPIAYAGDNASIDLDVSVGAAITTNLTGDRVFFGPGGQGSASDLFQAVTDLRDGLSTNNRALIQSAYDNLQTIHGRLQDLTTEVGGRQASLDQLEESLGSFNLSLQSIQNTYEALDYPEAITAYTREDTAQQAALSTLAKSNQQNLFDYLG
ncbi:MAG: Flagellar hook-associated protein 3 [Acidobacteria bacterium ADurb.Bin340]|nr:MAG: Flagellar hook-associated protein 3 [Acidobacteria bacterium ADurb.Bin340]